MHKYTLCWLLTGLLYINLLIPVVFLRREQDSRHSWAQVTRGMSPSSGADGKAGG